MKDLVDCHYASLWIGRSYAFKANAITIGVCNLLWAIPTCFLNILVLIAFNKKRSLRKAGNKILISLSISDLMSGLIAQPFWIASVFVAVTTPRQKVPCWLIITTNLCGYVLACTSLLTVSFVSFERYVAIFLPFFSSRQMTSKLFYIVSASIWLVSLIIVIGFLFLELFHAFFWCNIVVIVFSYVWNIFVYVRITRQIYKVRRTVEKRHSRFSNQEAVVKSKGTQVTVAIIITLLLCYLPQVMTSIARLITHQPFVMEFMEYWAITFGLMNPGFNPLFYCYYKTEIRNEISQILGIKFGGRDGRRDSTPTATNNTIVSGGVRMSIASTTNGLAAGTSSAGGKQNIAFVKDLGEEGGCADQQPQAGNRVSFDSIIEIGSVQRFSVVSGVPDDGLGAFNEAHDPTE